MALSAPIDQNGFVTSFDITDNAAISLFFNKFGFVIVHNVLNELEIEETIDEFHEKFNFQNNDDLEAISQEMFAASGIIGEGPDLKSRSQLNNRQNPNVHCAFSTVLKTDKLIVDHDRLGVMRPTIYQKQEKEKWLHLDCNPNLGNISVAGFARKTNNNIPIDFDKVIMVQGLISLTTAYIEDGGFHCVPGSHRFSKQWATKNAKHATRETINVPQDDNLHNCVQKIPLRAGSLLIWNSLLFHGNFPNHSDRSRMVQYLRFMESTSSTFAPLAPTIDRYPPYWQMTDLGKQLFGLEDYKKYKCFPLPLTILAGIVVLLYLQRK